MPEVAYYLWEYGNAYYELSGSNPGGYTKVSGGNYQIDSSQSDFSGLTQLFALYCSSTGDFYYTTSTSTQSLYESYGYTNLTSPGYAWSTNPSPGSISPYTAIPMYYAYNGTTYIHCFGNYSQINSLGSAWTTYLTTPVFYLVS